MKPALRILIVDDEINFTKCLNIIFSDNNYKAYTANDPKEGYELAQQVKPHIILSDYMMPYENGLEFCSRVRKTEIIRDCLFLIMTNKTVSQETKDKFHELLDGWITKIDGLQNILETIDKWVKLTKDSFDY